jgi:hypothetical protein
VIERMNGIAQRIEKVVNPFWGDYLFLELTKAQCHKIPKTRNPTNYFKETFDIFRLLHSDKEKQYFNGLFPPFCENSL